MTDPNPYRPPDAAAPDRAVACPSCGKTGSTRVTFTWWGGFLGPRVFSAVACLSCQTQYNSRTGRPLTQAIVLWNVVGLAIAVAVLYLIYTL